MFSEYKDANGKLVNIVGAGEERECVTEWRVREISVRDRADAIGRVFGVRISDTKRVNEF